MKKHKFNQVEVFMIERRIGMKFKERMFDVFVKTANEFDFKVKPTGGNFFTHELIGGDKEDFNTILELLAGV